MILIGMFPLQVCVSASRRRQRPLSARLGSKPLRIRPSGLSRTSSSEWFPTYRFFIHLFYSDSININFNICIYRAFWQWISYLRSQYLIRRIIKRNSAYWILSMLHKNSRWISLFSLLCFPLSFAFMKFASLTLCGLERWRLVVFVNRTQKSRLKSLESDLDGDVGGSMRKSRPGWHLSSSLHTFISSDTELSQENL